MSTTRTPEPPRTPDARRAWRVPRRRLTYAASAGVLATGLAVAFATRGAMAGNKEIVDVLHLVGGDDAFIAREFQIRFLRLGLKGGAAGGVAALLFIGLAGLAAGSLRASPAGDQIEALFGAFDMGLSGYLVVVLIGLVVAVVTAIVSRITVRRYLADLR